LKNHIRIFLVLCLALLIGGKTEAQVFGESPIIRVSGVILNKEDRSPVPYVSIMNRSNLTGTITDTAGHFSILMPRHDTLHLSAIGFKNVYLSVPDSIESNMYFINIILDKKTYSISTVKVYGLTKKEQFKREFTELKIEPTVQEANAMKNFPDFQTSIKNTTQNPQPTISLGSPITALYDQFSKEGKSKRKLAELTEQDKISEKIKTKFNEKIVGTITRFKGDTLTSFMKFCNFPESFILNAGDYDLAVAIKRKYYEYKREFGIKEEN